MLKIIINYFVLISLFFGQLNTFKIFQEENDYFFKSTSKSNEKIFDLEFVFLSEFSKNATKTYVDIAPRFSIEFSKNTKAVFAASIVKNDSYFSLQKSADVFYQYKDFKKFNYMTKLAFFKHRFSFGSVKLGRFYDKIGSSPFESLLVGNHDYHDGYILKLRYKKIEFSNRFFQLAPFRTNTSINRYFHEHGLKWHITNNYSIQFHETSLYSGLNASPQTVFLNPLSVYHAAQLNNGVEANTMYFIAAKYKNINTDIWFEFLLDDFQIDPEEESKGNKEPTEFAVLLGASHKLERHRFFLNLLLVRNRTYNDPNAYLDGIAYNKFIDHGRVIGIEKGSNLFKLDFRYFYKLGMENYAFLKLENNIYGDESVFGKFNKDFFNYTVNFFEPIPYGERYQESGITLGYRFHLFDITNIYSLKFDSESNISFFVSLQSHIF